MKGEVVLLNGCLGFFCWFGSLVAWGSLDWVLTSPVIFFWCYKVDSVVFFPSSGATFSTDDLFWCFVVIMVFQGFGSRLCFQIWRLCLSVLGSSLGSWVACVSSFWFRLWCSCVVLVFLGLLQRSFSSKGSFFSSGVFKSLGCMLWLVSAGFAGLQSSCVVFGAVMGLSIVVLLVFCLMLVWSLKRSVVMVGEVFCCWDWLSCLVFLFVLFWLGDCFILCVFRCWDLFLFWCGSSLGVCSLTIFIESLEHLQQLASGFLKNNMNK